MKKREEMEMKLYECLGVRQFQNLVFKLEKVIHFKDKGKNINYHVKSGSIDELKEFQKYLYFNGFIHVRNNIGLVAFTIVQQMFFSDWFLLYTIPSMLKNTYCVMLQRYNYLRINKVIEGKQKVLDRKVEKKKQEFIQENKEAIKKIKRNKQSLEQIQSLKKFLQGEEDVVLDESSLEMLTLIRNFVSDSKEKDVQINEKEKAPYSKKIGGI